MPRDCFPIIAREFGVLFEVSGCQPMHQVRAGVKEGAERKKSARAEGEGAFLQIDDVSEDVGVHHNEPSELRLVVAMIVKQAKRAARADGVTVEVGEHLLAT